MWSTGLEFDSYAFAFYWEQQLTSHASGIQRLQGYWSQGCDWLGWVILVWMSISVDPLVRLSHRDRSPGGVLALHWARAGYFCLYCSIHNNHTVDTCSLNASLSLMFLGITVERRSLLHFTQRQTLEPLMWEQELSPGFNIRSVELKGF